MRPPNTIKILLIKNEVFDVSWLGQSLRDLAYIVKEFGNENDLLSYLDKNDAEFFICPLSHNEDRYEKLICKIRDRLSELPLIIAVATRKSLALEKVLDLGAVDLIHDLKNVEELHSFLQRHLGIHTEVWSRKLLRTQSAFDISINIPGSNLPRKLRGLDIGRGGIFVAAPPLGERFIFPVPGARLRFQLNLDDNDAAPIVGAGTVRWVRKRGNERNPAGFGLEFSQLSQEAHDLILNFIRKHNIRAHIPKGGPLE